MLLRIPLQEFTSNLSTDKYVPAQNLDQPFSVCQAWDIVEEKSECYFFTPGCRKDSHTEGSNFASEAFPNEPGPGTKEQYISLTTFDLKGRELCHWRCFTMRLNNGSKILFVKSPDVDAFSADVKESLVSLLEFAEDILECESVVTLIDKNRGDVEVAIKAFMYAGFRMLPPAISQCSSEFVAVGINLS